MYASSNMGGTVISTARRAVAILMSVVFLAVWTTARADAASEPTQAAGFVSVGDGTKVLDTADGRWVVEIDKAVKVVTVTSPEGAVETFGPDSGIWEDAAAVSAEVPGSTQFAAADGSVNTTASSMATSNSTACTWAVWLIGVIQTSTWAYAIGLLALNPPAAAALTAIVTLGYGAFWNWVSTKC